MIKDLFEKGLKRHGLGELTKDEGLKEIIFKIHYTTNRVVKRTVSHKLGALVRKGKDLTEKDLRTTGNVKACLVYLTFTYFTMKGLNK